QSTVPAGLSNVVAISASGIHSAALRNDGTIVIWGIEYPQYILSVSVPSDIANVIQIASGGDRDAVIFGTRAPRITLQPFNRSLFKGSNTTFYARAAGV